MISNWQEFEEWVRNSNLSHWIVARTDNFRNKDEGGAVNNTKIVDSDFYGQDMDSKLAMTKTVLSRYNGRAYAYGWQGAKSTGAICEEVMFAGAGVSGMYGFGAPTTAPAVPDEAAIEARLRKQIMADLEHAQYEKERKALDQEKREFEKDKASAIGLMVGYLKPVISAVAGRGLKNVAGTPGIASIDAPQNVTAERVHQDPAAQEAPANEPDTFTDDEAEQLMILMERFKKVEPDYIRLIEAVVTMAESGDATYNMAKGVLLK